MLFKWEEVARNPEIYWTRWFSIKCALVWVKIGVVPVCIIFFAFDSQNEQISHLENGKWLPYVKQKRIYLWQHYFLCQYVNILFFTCLHSVFFSKNTWQRRSHHPSAVSHIYKGYMSNVYGECTYMSMAYTQKSQICGAHLFA
jgi:hypothetical protein